ncbi:MAG: ribonuclease J [Clostridia bacterium]|nr:ribonuclease J [Oscillospiraceae bacterium]MBQ2749081.1 ribonuclease J [Clostridia bacterium]MBR6763676.1 ribonuclease J [Clostridia bacterium]
MAKSLKIIPLGGLNEIGKNMTAYEYGNDIIVVDAGVAFPDDEMFGVDLVIPDISYLIKNKKRVRAIFITHGHEDHIGAIPYVMRDLDCPIYCTRLTAGIVEIRLIEHQMLDRVELIRFDAGDVMEVGCFTVEAIHVNHSIADAVAFAITSPAGVVVQTGDFKIDLTPIQGGMIDLTRFGELGQMGVDLLLSDSTNVEREGYAMSERMVGRSLEALFDGCDKRIIVSTFASNVHRIQQIINAAYKYGRKVAVTGRSMENILNVASGLGYIDIPFDTLIDLNKIKQYPPNKLCIISTGSQGEPMSALYRMAFSGHRQITISDSDMVILSSSAIPGNEKSIYRLINELFRKGAEVVYEKLDAVHVSGHACKEELKMILSLTKPKNFMPVHGEYRHLKTHATLAEMCGVNRKNIFLNEIGRVLELYPDGTCKLNGTVPSGKLLVDGYGVGDVGSVVLRDRKLLSQDGLITVVVAISSADGSLVAGPDIVSRGFVYMKEAEELLDEIRQTVIETVGACQRMNIADPITIKGNISDEVKEILYHKTKRSPMVLPVVMVV